MSYYTVHSQIYSHIIQIYFQKHHKNVKLIKSMIHCMDFGSNNWSSWVQHYYFHCQYQINYCYPNWL